jgi:Putative Actinobacterial Holin-X, holin superfamily III
MTNQPSIAELVKELRDESTLLLREEVALAKKEISEKISSSVLNVSYVGAGALVAYCAGIFLLLSISSLISAAFVRHGVSAGWAVFLGLLIVGVAVGVIGIAMIVKAIERLKKISLVPEKTIQTLKEDKTWAQNKIH